MTVDADVTAAVARTLDSWGRLDVLYNNAGVDSRGSVADATEDDWDRCFSVNVKGTFLCSRAAVPHLAASGGGRRHPGWACYHTEMWTVDLDGIEIGVVGMAVGAPFAVVVAEQLAASGAELILSITSAGQISAVDELPCFVLIEKALRDEGTSLHYQPPGRWSHLDDELRRRLAGAFGA